MPRTPKAAPPPLMEAHLGFWLRFVSNHVSGRFRRLLEAQDTTVTEWVALRTLYGRPQTTHAELIDVLGMTKGAASKLVTRLERKGLARRGRGDDDRGQTLALTATGQALVPKLAAEAERNEAHFFAHLDAAQRLALLDALQALVAHHRMKQVPVE